MRILAALVGLAALTCLAPAASLTLEVAGTRSQSDLDRQIDAAARNFGLRAARLTQRPRQATGVKAQFSLPITLVLTRNGIPLPVQRTRSGDITLSFEASGSRSFPLAYRTRIQDTFNSARPAMNAVFGAPKTGRSIRVLNYDADISDRQAVAGGVFIPNAPGGPEIRLPVYNSLVSASINAIHCFLLAYRDNAALPFDAWNEGMVRAATMAAARTPGAIPGAPAEEEIEGTLDSLYDAGAVYDWTNQPGLAAHPFIAPNLLAAPLPLGGSVGGPYLLRYQMAGTAWAKALVERPGLLAEFNRRFYATPALFTTYDQLAALMQEALNTVSGSASGTIEGLSAADWLREQHIFDTTVTTGPRVVIQAFPLAPEPGSTDFGPFGIVVHATRGMRNGDELLLNGRSFPVYWRPDNLRFFTSIQDDIIDFAGGYGSAAPNFPRSVMDNAQYRVIVDAPFLGRTPRVVLPAGAIATGQNTSPASFFGTLSGFPSLAAGAYIVRVEWPGGGEQTQVVNGAFGIRIAEPSFQRSQPLTVRVLRPEGAVLTEVQVQRVNKTPGSIGLNIRARTSLLNLSFPYAAGYRLAGSPVSPLRADLSPMAGADPAARLAAEWSPRNGRWILTPELNSLYQGTGLIVRSQAAGTSVLRGWLDILAPQTVALEPGWNLVSPPAGAAAALASLAAASGAEALSTYAQAAGSILGPTIFRAAPGAGGGFPAYQPATQLEPGQAYWVKCLRPDGAILAFGTGGSAAPSRTAGSSPATLPQWEAQARLWPVQGGDTWVQFGQAAGATRGIDPRFDTELPPAAGPAPQASLTGAQPLFRDMRSTAGPEAWTVRFSGLTPGAIYQYSISFTRGAAPLVATDMATGQGRAVRPFLFATFRARSATHDIRVSMPGAR